MRVTFIITGLDTGGAEHMLFKLLSALKGTPLDASVIVLRAGGPVQAAIAALGVPIFSLDLQRPTDLVRACRRLARLIETLRPDLIQGWMLHGNLAAQLAGWLSRRPTHVVWSVRQSLVAQETEKATTDRLLKMAAWLSSCPSAIVYNSRDGAERHHAIGYDASRTHVIPNGFDTELFKPDPVAREAIRRACDLPAEAFVIGLFGRYHPVKGHAIFIEAAARFAQRVPQAYFLLAGREITPENRALREQIAAHGLAARCRLLGERRDVAHLMAALDLATSASLSEAFSNTIGESMACGIPQVVTQVGDSAWLVGAAGLSVPTGDAGALADAWYEIWQLPMHERNAQGQTARQRIVDSFALDTIAARYLGLYDELMASKPDRSALERPDLPPSSAPMVH